MRGILSVKWTDRGIIRMDTAACASRSDREPLACRPGNRPAIRARSRKRRGFMTFLIDGYNLMHFLGLVRPRGTRSLEKSRLDLQQWLHRTHGQQVGDVWVIYDGRVSPRPDHIQDDRGLRIQFSTGQAADDLIEELIRRQTQP